MGRKARQFLVLMAVAAAVLLVLMDTRWLSGLLDAAQLLLAAAVAVTLAWFVWRVFLYRLWRVHHIKRIRERREFQEVLDR